MAAPPFLTHILVFVSALQISIRLLLLSAVLAVMVGSVNSRFLGNINGPNLFLTLEDTSGGSLKLYWDTGLGFNENETMRVPLGTYAQHTFKLPLPENLRGLRIDPETPSDFLHVKQARIGWLRWPFSHSMPGEIWHPANELERTLDSDSPSHASFRIHPAATDPYLVADLASVPPEVITPLTSRHSVHLVLIATPLLSALLGAGFGLLSRQP